MNLNLIKSGKKSATLSTYLGLNLVITCPLLITGLQLVYVIRQLWQHLLPPVPKIKKIPLQ